MRSFPDSRRGIPLGRVFGIELRIDASWLIIFALVSVSMVGYFSHRFPGRAPGLIWAAALGTGLVFFASLLLHEISHSLVARAKGLEVQGITLFMFGGISQLREEPRRPWDEFLIALVGPLASILVGLAFVALELMLPAGSLARGAAGWLGRINFVLAVFNLLPGFPLDGGRMVRAAAWGITQDFRRATRIASTLGSVIAFGLVGWGIALILWTGGLVEGLWFGLIGWFLLVASRQSVGQLELRENLRRLRVEQAIRTPCTRVPAHLRVDQFVDEFVFRRGGRCFFVTQDEIVVGLVTLEDLRRVARDDWPGTSLRDVMVPLSRLKSVAPSDSLLVAFERMNEASVGELPVVEGDRILGVITHEDITRLTARFVELTRGPPD
jgi:Zn-dependent protease